MDPTQFILSFRERSGTAAAVHLADAARVLVAADMIGRAADRAPEALIAWWLSGYLQSADCASSTLDALLAAIPSLGLPPLPVLDREQRVMTLPSGTRLVVTWPALRPRTTDETPHARTRIVLVRRPRAARRW